MHISKILGNHFLKICFFVLITIDKLFDNMPDIFDGKNIMNPLILLMMFDTSFSLTN